MNTPLHDLVSRTFSVLKAKDLDALMELFAEDAVVIDPHFPAQTLQGQAAIAEGFRVSMGRMRSYGYEVTNSFESENGQRAAVEVATHHVLRTGKSLEFPQVFVVETANGCITRMQAYEPYGPHGTVGFFLSLAHLKQRLSGARLLSGA